MKKSVWVILLGAAVLLSACAADNTAGYNNSRRVERSEKCKRYFSTKKIQATDDDMVACINAKSGK